MGSHSPAGCSTHSFTEEAAHGSASRASGGSKILECQHHVVDGQTYCVVVPSDLKRALPTIPSGYSATALTETRRW